MLNSIARRSTLAATLVVMSFGPGCNSDQNQAPPPTTFLPQPVPDAPTTPPKADRISGQGSGSQPDDAVGP